MISCEVCGREFTRRGVRGRVPRYCGQTCRKRASRAPHRRLLELSPHRWVRAVGKRPVMVDGSPASSTNPATWTDFEHVQAGAGNGFGVMLGGGLGCYDLDHCLEGEHLAGWAHQAIDAIKEPIVFVERSSSGTGLHVFVQADEQRGYRRGGVEFYSRARFIKTTLNPYRL